MVAWKWTVVGVCEFAEEVGATKMMMVMTKKERGRAAIFTVLVGPLEPESSESCYQFNRFLLHSVDLLLSFAVSSVNVKILCSV